MADDLVLYDPKTKVWLTQLPGDAAASWNPITRAERMLLVKSMQSQDFDAADVIGQTFAIQHVLVHRITIPDEETGADKRVTRTVLIGPDGSRIACVSDGVLRSLDAIAAGFGSPPWEPPIVVTLKEERGKKGFRYYVLEPKE